MDISRLTTLELEALLRQRGISVSCDAMVACHSHDQSPPLSTTLLEHMAMRDDIASQAASAQQHEGRTHSYYVQLCREHAITELTTEQAPHLRPLDPPLTCD